ncbi:Insulin-like growth factor-binding protein complex acid labile subunit [Cyphomyrmex costatus]|uniref:Insulin-like growth factor-binding protein complex acid labile subunit n=2 Tax=Cyphomyrmex costatus TaxID=456900 RepID=A0A195C981_9HYME|nr:Insulin-like growth factor-binding protein complex acid labile subunit [Cyphomyrmex costatus]
MRHHGVFLSSLITWLTILSVTRCQSICPDRCLCHLNQLPRTIECSNQGILTFPENISDVVENLDLSSNGISEITNEVNRLIDLQYLNMAKNQLKSLPNDINELRKLRKLDLSHNLIVNTADIASISQLPSLTVLYISRNLLPDLKGLTSEVLQAVDAGHCLIKELGNDSLNGLSALNTLSLTGNPLKSIRTPVSETLRWLDMSDCALNYLYPDTFIGFPELEELRLVNNPTLVYSTRYSTLEHIKLKRLDVSRCNLDRPGLHGLPSLTQARLSYNTIRLLPDRIFAKNRQLTHLYLNSNNLALLNASTFEGLTKLQILDLSANSLEEIHKLAFQDNIDLRLLNLSYNSLHRFPYLMSLVTTLDLSFNLINHFRANSLEDLSRIRSLYLKDNNLQSLPRSLNSRTLRILDVQRNRLVELHNDSFAELPSLQKVDLSGNRLTEAMNPNIFQNNLDLKIVRLDDNPWRCDCMQLYDTFVYLTEPPPKTVASTLICQSPANISGYSWETACFDEWNTNLYYPKDRTWGMVMISLLILVVLCGSVVSIKHTLKIKRRVLEQRRQMELTEERERLRRLQRRNQRIEEVEIEEFEAPEEIRINPLELVGPPSYEEAVQMRRLVHSMDALNEISIEDGTLRSINSMDNLRTKKRRTRRPRKRTQSEDDLLRREERRQERIRRERNNSSGNICDTDQLHNTNPRTSSARRARRHSIMDETLESSSSKDRPRPQTPTSKKRKRRHVLRNEHVTDDEDSDVQIMRSNRSIVIKELKREPKSGYRESYVERES